MAQNKPRFLVLTAPVEGPWRAANREESFGNPDDRFIFAEKKWDSNLETNSMSYYRLLKEFRERLSKNEYASDTSAQGWTMDEVESLVELWKSGYQPFAVIGSLVFPEAFTDRPLDMVHARHGAYNYMMMRMSTRKFETPK